MSPEPVPPALAEAVVRDAMSGAPVRVDSLWTDRTVVLVLVRHFG